MERIGEYIKIIPSINNKEEGASFILIPSQEVKMYFKKYKEPFILQEIIDSPQTIQLYKDFIIDNGIDQSFFDRNAGNIKIVVNQQGVILNTNIKQLDGISFMVSLEKIFGDIDILDKSVAIQNIITNK